MSKSTWILKIIFLTNIVLLGHFPPQISTESPPLELYNSTDTGITLLTSATFNATIFTVKPGESENLIWFIQFYNTWCGHCQRFASSWKSLANTTLAWQKYLRLAVLDCAKKENAPACNQFSISSFPTMTFIPPRMKIDAHNTSQYMGPHTEMGVYLGMLDYMDKIEFPDEAMAVIPKTIVEFWKDLPSLVDNVALIVETPDSKLGRDVLLSVLGHVDAGLAVRRTTTLNNVLLSSMMGQTSESGMENAATLLWHLKRNGETSKIIASEVKPQAYINAIFSLDDNLLVAKGRDKPVRKAIPYLQPANVHDVKKQSNLPVKNVQAASINMTDLVSAIIYMFSMEVASHKLIQHDQFFALQKFVRAIAHLVPFPAQTRIPLEKLSEVLRKESSTTAVKVTGILKENGFDAENLTPTWTGCKGSVPGRRGYPCSLWQIFHTLTVAAVKKELTRGKGEQLQGGNDVLVDDHGPGRYAGKSAFSGNALDKDSGILTTIFGYVKHFFSCQECVENFQREMDDLLKQTNVLSNRDAVLWLWKAHNAVNRRLAGDVTEDDGYPKIQFPSIEQCPHCRLRSSGDVIRWKDGEVVDYLLIFYSNDPIVPFNVRDLKHREMAGLQDPRDASLASSAEVDSSSSTVRLYVFGVIFLVGAAAGFREIQRWRKRNSATWDFGYSKARVKWM